MCVYYLCKYISCIMRNSECNLFYVRSVKNNEQSDNSLVKWLLLIVAIGSAFLLNWALSNELRPKPEVRYDQLGLKYFTCSITEWNFISMASNDTITYHCTRQHQSSSLC